MALARPTQPRGEREETAAAGRAQEEESEEEEEEGGPLGLENASAGPGPAYAKKKTKDAGLEREMQAKQRRKEAKAVALAQLGEEMLAIESKKEQIRLDALKTKEQVQALEEENEELIAQLAALADAEEGDEEAERVSGMEKGLDRKSYMIDEAGSKYAWTTDASKSLQEARIAHAAQSAFGKERSRKVSAQIEEKLRLQEAGPHMADHLVSYFKYHDRKELQELRKPIGDGPEPNKKHVRQRVPSETMP